MQILTPLNQQIVIMRIVLNKEMKKFGNQILWGLVVVLVPCTSSSTTSRSTLLWNLKFRNWY